MDRSASEHREAVGLIRFSARQLHSRIRVVGARRRERVTIDLRGLGPALRAHAKTNQLTVAAAARSLLAASLGESRSRRTTEPDGTCDMTASVKLTLRVRPSAARLLSERARAARQPYVGILLDGSPAPALAADQREAVRALGVC
jgi:hypothetical protein